jgi:hypothetical protein
LYLDAGFSLAVLPEFQYILEILSLSLRRVVRSETKFYVASIVLYYYTCEIVLEGNTQFTFAFGMGRILKSASSAAKRDTS